MQKTQVRNFESLSLVFLLLSACGGGGIDLEVSTTGAATALGGTSYDSSTQLLVEWEDDLSDYQSLVVTATDPFGGQPISVSLEASATSTTLTGLKTATAYSVILKACEDSSCSKYQESDSVEAETPEEVWQLQGSGHLFADLTSLISDGNARLSATWFGNDSAAGVMAGKVQLYYGPGGSSTPRLAVGVMSGTATTGSASSVSSFTSTAGTYGLDSPSTATSWIGQVATGQGVPTGGTLGAKIRLFFEASDSTSIGGSSENRIFSLDSQDGYVGLDFHGQSTKAICNTTSDYSSSTACLPTLVIGNSTDDATRFANINQARQFKLGWPTLTDWRWNGEAGTFMIFTVEVPTSCSSSSYIMQSYAQYDGSSQWDVQFDDSTGCPHIFERMQAPSPMHLGDAKYKVYFGDPSVSDGKTTSSNLPWLGPKMVLYGDGAVSGDSGSLSVSDWEERDVARAIRFLWPDGTELSAHEIGYIDDFQFMTPTGSLTFQAAFLTLAEPDLGVSGNPKDSLAILVNP